MCFVFVAVFLSLVSVSMGIILFAAFLYLVVDTSHFRGYAHYVFSSASCPSFYAGPPPPLLAWMVDSGQGGRCLLLVGFSLMGCTFCLVPYLGWYLLDHATIVICTIDSHKAQTRTTDINDKWVWSHHNIADGAAHWLRIGYNFIALLLRKLISLRMNNLMTALVH